MKVRVLKYLRGPAMVADPGAEIEIPDGDAPALLAAGAVERAAGVERAVEAPAERAVVPEPEAQPVPQPRGRGRGRSRKKKSKKVSGG